MGGVSAQSVGSSLSAAGSGAGGIQVAATYGGSIEATVAAIAASLTFSKGAGDAVALGAAVALNLIGWRGTVADETPLSSAPITLTAKVSGGTMSATGAVQVLATSNATIDATTAAAAVAIAVSTSSSGGSSGGGANAPKSSGTPVSPTDANTEGKGAHPENEGQALSPTDDKSGTQNGNNPSGSSPKGVTMIDEGSDVSGSSSTNSTEAGGATAGEGTQANGASNASSAQSQSGGSTSSLGLTAAGVYTENKISTQVTAAIENVTSVSSGAGGVTVTATDNAQIHSVDAAAAVTANLAGGSSSSTAVAVGIGIARNTIQDSVDAHVSGSTVTGAGSPLTVQAFESDTIEATSVAAALAISASSGSSSLGFAGGGSLADNLIGVNANAYVSSSTLGTSLAPLGAVTVQATDTSSIHATVAAFAAAVSVSLESSGTAVAIGASLAHNRISDGTDLGNGSVDAYIATSNINAGAIAVTATSQQTITALTAAAALALSGGDNSGLGVSGAGAVALNEINLNVNASIDGSHDDTAGLPGINTAATYSIASTGVTVSAADTSSIDALVAAAAVAGGFGGESGYAVAIGIAFARNAITNPVNAAITNVSSLTTSGGAVQVTASEAARIHAESYAAAVAVGGGGTSGVAVAGGGSLAFNIIAVDTTANIAGSNIGSASPSNKAGDVIVTAIDSSEIDAEVAAVAASVAIGGESGIGVALGVSVAENEINDGSGGRGTLQAGITSTSIQATGAVDVEAYSTQTIDADTLAGAMAISGGGGTGVAVAGAGVGVKNLIDLGITADIDGGGTTQITAGRVSVDAYDQSQINAVDGAAAVSASFGGETGAAVLVGLSLAWNTMH